MKMYDLIIIGSGPAGLCAAIYGKRAGLDTLVLEKLPMGGGQVLNTWEVDNYPGLPGINGFDLGMKFREHAQKAGAVFEEADVTGLTDGPVSKLVHTAQGDYEGRAVIIASGASHRRLGVPGEERLAGRGISYCATCDGAFYKGKTAAVVGGGDAAAEDAAFLARLCEKVYVIHRRDALRAAASLQERLLSLPNVEMVWNCTVEEILGEQRVEGLLLRDRVTGASRSLAADGVFIAVGTVPESGAFAGTVETDGAGYLRAGEDCVTNVPGIFAAGDVRTKALRQIVTAAADGANAVASAEAWLLSR